MATVVRGWPCAIALQLDVRMEGEIDPGATPWLFTSEHDALNLPVPGGAGRLGLETN